MELAPLLAVGLGDWVDFGVIVAILLLNAFVGFYQEKQAADVVASLEGDIAMSATAARDGQEQQVLARELVPGDIVSGQLDPSGGALLHIVQSLGVAMLNLAYLLRRMQSILPSWPEAPIHMTVMAGKMEESIAGTLSPAMMNG